MELRLYAWFKEVFSMNFGMAVYACAILTFLLATCVYCSADIYILGWPYAPRIYIYARVQREEKDYSPCNSNR